MTQKGNSDTHVSVSSNGGRCDRSRCGPRCRHCSRLRHEHDPAIRESTTQCPQIQLGIDVAVVVFHILKRGRRKDCYRWAENVRSHNSPGLFRENDGLCCIDGVGTLSLARSLNRGRRSGHGSGRNGDAEKQKSGSHNPQGSQEAASDCRH